MPMLSMNDLSVRRQTPPGAEWEQGRTSDRVLRRVAEGKLLTLKGTI